MVLNYDCLRAVLLALEKNLTLDDDLRFYHINLSDILGFDELRVYSKKDIYYCIYNLIEIGFVDGDVKFADAGVPYYCYVNNINYSGHEFLQSIKSNTVWENIKSKLKPVAGLSISLIAEVAKEIIASSLKIN